MRAWELHQAGAGLPELVELAESEGPQDITVSGKSVAVVVSRSTFERLSGSGQSLVEFMRQSPLYGLEELDFEREGSSTRALRL
ncbi:MAG: type II toxin-antitoxin system prevent-host-death family antitoxin [Candidatus Accumulibacter phosphatis]|uniref:Type II toxin-antitoxin system prevent-host-death family antitoxin n=1 Tax=Candidatus Accumulibacter phosphatis TaxID=327160 RepID=A0A6A7RRN1_9PROT|nr:type II toxin-antitoxin system prevent-host-death family antitoxin [Candidatus Accumulibacter phosphatis]